ncbi:hypothetical protein [Luteimonas sp. RC10]|uniref:hypothetical protein n=1 Tax=Luteimonas sp. RC10 TaxID=2587035 RepID=UPI00160B1803|nr:hypothetical protein [Luteimonas sp. RC10]MBB3343108.1 hypothetical protein [Luteimonas sp. RC10]
MRSTEHALRTERSMKCKNPRKRGFLKDDRLASEGWRAGRARLAGEGGLAARLDSSERAQGMTE